MSVVFADYSDKVKSWFKLCFNDAFMQKYTRFQTFEAFQYSSAVFVNWKTETLIYNEDIFDGFVDESTQFKTWEEMAICAVDTFCSSKKKMAEYV